MDNPIPAQALHQQLLAQLDADFKAKNPLNASGDMLPVAYTSALSKARLDYSKGSLSRLEKLLTTLRNKTQPNYSAFTAQADKLNFLYLLGFYLGETVTKLAEARTTWLDAKSAQMRGIELKDSLTERYVVDVEGLMLKPLAFLLNKLFAHTPHDCLGFVEEFLAQLNLHRLDQPVRAEDVWKRPAEELEPEISTAKNSFDFDALDNVGNTDYPTLQKTTQNKPVQHEPARQNQVKNTSEQPKHIAAAAPFHETPTKEDVPILTTETLAQTPESLNTHKDTDLTVDQEVEPAKRAQNYKNVIKKSDAQTLNYPQAPTRPKPSGNNEDQLSYEEKYGVNYNASILYSFKPPVLPHILASVLPALLSLYVVKRMVFDDGLDVTHFVWLALFLLVLAVIWVNYAMSSIGVYDAKVSWFSLLGSRTAHFDKRTRFYHIQSDGQFMGTPQHVLVKTNIEQVKLRAQKQSELEDALIDIENSLLVPRALNALKNGETVDFELLQLTQDSITYGTRVASISEIGDFAMSGNDLGILNNNGKLIARLDMKSVPNINTLVTLIGKLQKG